MEGFFMPPRAGTGIGKAFGDGSWFVGTCESECSGDTFSAAVIMTSSHAFFVTRKDVGGYEGFEGLLAVLKATNAEDLEKKLSASSDWSRVSNESRIVRIYGRSTKVCSLSLRIP